MEAVGAVKYLDFTFLSSYLAAAHGLGQAKERNTLGKAGSAKEEIWSLNDHGEHGTPLSWIIFRLMCEGSKV